MVFKRDDIYTSSGSTQLFNSWTPYVSKFDTSSFYNWEQDNLPLYDLEERTYEMWEQGGFPTSAVPGLALTVSADTPAATLLADSNIFTDVSSCIASLPKVIRFPVLIEVCNFADLGKLELHNFRIEESGSIEIINRAYTKVYDASASIEVIIADPLPEQNSTNPMIASFLSNDVSATLFSSIGANQSTSSLILSTLVLSGPVDERMQLGANTFLYPRLTLRSAPLNVSLNQAVFGTANTTDYKFRTPCYENNVVTSVDNTLGTTDISALNQFDGTELSRVKLAATDPIGGSIYLNTLTKLSVKNCDGPIYIRNFCVNGESSPTGGRNVGIEITNSDVLLENCAAARCKEAGFRFNNSKVVLSRSAFSYRNYTLTTNTTRKAQTGVGFHAINSDVSISALVSATTETGVAGDFQASGDDVMVIASRNYAGFKLDNSRLTGGFQRQFASDEDTGGIVSTEVNTGYGFLADNSEVNLVGLLDVYGNDKGIQATNSKFKYDNLCVDCHSNQGIRCENSVFLFDSVVSPEEAGQAARKQLDFSGNGQHLDLQKQSEFSFVRKNHIPIIFGNTSFVSAHGVISWSGAPQSNLPAISVDDNSVADFIQAKLLARSPVWTVGNSVDYGLAARAVNNSKISFFGSGSGCNFIWGPPGYTYQQKTSGLYAGNNSEINLFGPTVIAQFGVDALAENNSTINIEPPRIRSYYGVEASGFDLSSQLNQASVELHATRACLVVNKNSTLNLKDLGSYAVHWPGTTAGDTMITAGTDYPTEDYDNSGLVGYGSLQFYPNPQDSNAITVNNLDNILAAGLADGGIGPALPDFPVFKEQTKMNTLLVTDNPIGDSTSVADRGKISLGGVCVRAVADSVVNVLNVHFPTGNDGGTMDDLFYNASGSDCARLMIWNLADTSRLNASYCSVSGEYPSESDYQGPSALYVSSSVYGEYNAEYHIASGAPSGTPDTGTLSILDSFGAGSAVWVVPSGVDINSPFDRFYPISGTINSETASALVGAGINVSSAQIIQYGGDGTAKNKGPFRIYWSPKSNSKFLAIDMSGYQYGASAGAFSGSVGPLYQIFSQGYNLSAPASALLFQDITSVSSIYPDLLKLSYDSDGDGIPDTLWTSGFYYCKEFVDDNPTQCLLDESAGDTFANAKNASLGSSGRPRKVIIYRARSDDSAGADPVNRGSEAYQGDRDVTVGYKSSNIFDLGRDN
jgi:hypothetical protein